MSGAGEPPRRASPESARTPEQPEAALPPHRVALRMLCQGATAGATAGVGLLGIVLLMARHMPPLVGLVAGAALTACVVGVYGAVYTLGEELAHRVARAWRLAVVGAITAAAPLLIAAAGVWVEALASGRGPLHALRTLARSIERLGVGTVALEHAVGLLLVTLPLVVLASLRLDLWPGVRRNAAWPLRWQLGLFPPAWAASLVVAVVIVAGPPGQGGELVRLFAGAAGLAAAFAVGLEGGRRLEAGLLSSRDGEGGGPEW